MPIKKNWRLTGMFLLCTGGLVTLSGCVSPPLERKSVLQSMVGQTALDVVHRFGVPTRTYKTAGHTFLAYVQTRTDYSPGSWGGYGYGYGYGYGPGLGAWGGGFPPTYTILRCQTTFELYNDRVLRWTLRGDGC